MVAEFLNYADSGGMYFGYLPVEIAYSHSNLVFELKDVISNRPTWYVKVFSLETEDLQRAYAELGANAILRNSTTLPIGETMLIRPEELDKVFIVQKELPGYPLSEFINELLPEQIEPLMDELVDRLFQIHDVKREKYGYMGDDEPTYNNWRDCFTADVIRKLDYLGTVSQLSEAQRLFFINKLKYPILDMNQHPTLIHGDYQPSNILIDPNTLSITGLLDFELARSWIADWDLARIAVVAFPDNPELFEIFLKKYCIKTNRDLSNTLEAIEYYRSFESLYYWAWGWRHDENLRSDILVDIELVTGIPFDRSD